MFLNIAMFFIAVDIFSKMSQVIPIENKQPEEMIGAKKR